MNPRAIALAWRASVTVAFFLHLKSFGWEQRGVGVGGVTPDPGVLTAVGAAWGATGVERLPAWAWIGRTGVGGFTAGAGELPNDADLPDRPELLSGCSLRRWPLWKFKSPPSFDIIMRSSLNLFSLAKSTSRLTTDAADSTSITSEAKRNKAAA